MTFNRCSRDKCSLQCIHLFWEIKPICFINICRNFSPLFCKFFLYYLKISHYFRIAKFRKCHNLCYCSIWKVAPLSKTIFSFLLTIIKSSIMIIFVLAFKQKCLFISSQELTKVQHNNLRSFENLGWIFLLGYQK